MRTALLIALLAVLTVGCEPLSEQDQVDKAKAVSALQQIGERLPILKARLEKLIERGKSIAVEVEEIRAKVKAGTFPAVDALELVSSLMAEKGEISKEILETKSAIEELLALGKKADETLEKIRKRNRWAWARTIGEGALALVLAYFGVTARKKGRQLTDLNRFADERVAELGVAEKTRDALIATIEKHPEAKTTALSAATAAGVLPALHDAVKRVT